MTIEREPATVRPRIPVTTGWGIALAFGVALDQRRSPSSSTRTPSSRCPTPRCYTTLKNGVAAPSCFGLALARRPAVRGPGPRPSARGPGWRPSGSSAAACPFMLFFSGLAIASAPTAAFIHKTLFIWVAVLAVPFLGERLGWFPIAALGVLLAGQVLVAPPTGVGWGTGETMIAGRDAAVGRRGRSSPGDCSSRTSRRRSSVRPGWGSAWSSSSATSRSAAACRSWPG